MPKQSRYRVSEGSWYKSESGSEPQSINNGNNTINIIEPEKQESR